MDAPDAINKDYRIIPENDVYLTAIIGDGQVGDPVVMLGSEVVQVGDINRLLIGKGKDICGKTLNVRTIVNDVNPKTNHTSITYILEGGPVILDITNQGELTNGDGSMTYRDKFKFTA